MRVLRGRAADHESDHERTRRLTAAVAESEEPALRVWQPHRQVAFGRRDAREDGYERARRIARERGYAVLERAVGGRAVAYTGQTVAVAFARPITDERTGIRQRYAAASDRFREALDTLGVDASEGEPPESFCPGSHSLQAAGKVVGIAQRVRQRVAVVAAIVLVADHREVADVLAPVYDALDVAFDPDSVGSVARAGGPSEPATVIDAVVETFADGHDTTVERVDPASGLRDT
ncbi:lipoate--protein ligase family protein [Halomicrobium sp. IBSBa]|uniref:lipoate--protein ligase family protein n=1 Tax=Halomicrobium sp. IBSBa TaxID=2778916 RepID=UPI001ABF4E11|nr:lipoate--protein ligase family protein [Halomicrobium sp. IBSBa]MBO4247209.1 lipoate--protein ligase family protein [Halomicrobium sp. IBSBa]